MLYIDGENMIYGRLSTFVAKSLLNGEDVVIINAHKVVVTGSRDFVLKKFRERRDIGSVRKGPYYPRTPSQILRRSIGDMIPKKKTTGKEALERCKVFTKRPSSLKDVKFESIKEAMNTKATGVVTLEEISRFMGYRVNE